MPASFGLAAQEDSTETNLEEPLIPNDINAYLYDVELIWSRSRGWLAGFSVVLQRDISPVLFASRTWRVVV